MKSQKPRRPLALALAQCPTWPRGWLDVLGGGRGRLVVARVRVAVARVRVRLLAAQQQRLGRHALLHEKVAAFHRQVAHCWAKKNRRRSGPHGSVGVEQGCNDVEDTRARGGPAHLVRISCTLQAGRTSPPACSAAQTRARLPRPTTTVPCHQGRRSKGRGQGSARLEARGQGSARSSETTGIKRASKGGARPGRAAPCAGFNTAPLMAARSIEGRSQRSIGRRPRRRDTLCDVALRRTPAHSDARSLRRPAFNRHR